MKKLYVPIFFTLCLLIVFVQSYGQKPARDKGIFEEHKNEFFDSIKKSVNEFNNPKKPEKKEFKMDFSGYKLPKDTSEFITYKHTPPISQGWTGTCWCFSGTSFLESEELRLYNKEIKFSEMFTVYWEYIEKVRRFVSERGNSAFGEGSECNAVLRIWKEYGCVPESAYTGLLSGQKFYDHHIMFDELNKYLQSVKESNAWNEDVVLGTVKTILNHYMGKPPEEFEFEGQNMTPKEFLADVAKINPDDYVDVMSLMDKPYWKEGEYEVPDNWWHSKVYHNVPLDDFMSSLINAVKNGYTVAIGGDVSEPGIDGHAGVAMIPSFDIPSKYIDAEARYFRFSNGSTTDDHGIHLIGYKKDGDKYWFLIKDSGSGSRNGRDKGYYFYDEDYVKLKMMTYLVNRSAIEDLLKKFK